MNASRNRRSYENLEKRIFSGIGKYDIPQLRSTTYEGNCDFIPFNYAKSEKHRENKGVHFFIDDYQFIRLWNNIDSYVDMLSQFQYVMTPDFSLYIDFPKVIQIFNHYRKHWIGAYLQEAGIKIIPTISWSAEESFEWCFDGEPTQSVVAVSSIGSTHSKVKKELFLAGYKAMMEILEPKIILFYGTVPKECEGNIVKMQAFQNKFDEVRNYGR